MKLRIMLLVAALVVVGPGMVLAGSPEPPGPPSSTFSLNLEAIYARLMSGAAGTPTAFTEPTVAPGTGTMVTLDQIMAAAPAEDNTNGTQPGEVLAGKSFWSLRTDGAGGSAWGLSVGTLPTRTVDATTVSQLAGYYEAFNLADVDTDLVPGNVRATTTIFGVAGNANVVNTSSGNALPGEILTGRVAWVDGAQVTGTMPNNGAVTITPGTTAQTIPAGFHNGSGTVVGDAELTGDNIREGVNIFGVDGYRRVSKFNGNKADTNLVGMNIRDGDVVLLQGVDGGYLKENDNGSVSVDSTYTGNNQAWVLEWNPTQLAWLFRNLGSGDYLSISTSQGVHAEAVGSPGLGQMFFKRGSLLLSEQSTYAYRMYYAMPENLLTQKCMYVGSGVANGGVQVGDCQFANECWRFVILSPDSATKAMSRPGDAERDVVTGARSEASGLVRRDVVREPKRESVTPQDQATSGKGN